MTSLRPLRPSVSPRSTVSPPRSFASMRRPERWYPQRSMALPSERRLRSQIFAPWYSADLCLRRLHAIPAVGLRTFDPIDNQSYLDEQSRRKGFPAWAASLGAFVRTGNAALARDGRRAFSHNDLAPGNVLWDGSLVWIVDWEAAGLEHPYVDLATFSNFSSLADRRPSVSSSCKSNRKSRASSARRLYRFAIFPASSMAHRFWA